jgi:hypothetical protein
MGHEDGAKERGGQRCEGNQTYDVGMIEILRTGISLHAFSSFPSTVTVFLGIAFSATLRVTAATGAIWEEGFRTVAGLEEVEVAEDL